MEEDGLQMVVERLRDEDAGVRECALGMLLDTARSSHARPGDAGGFRSLVEVLPVLEEVCEGLVGDQQKILCDIISAVCIAGEDRKLLEYRVRGNVVGLLEWGHLYVKKLLGCVVDARRGNLDFPFERTLDVSAGCVDFLFKHNAEFEAIDFLVEVERVDTVLEYVDAHNYNRVVLYLEEMDSFVGLGNVILEIDLKMGNHSRYVVGLLRRGMIERAIEYVRGIEEEDYRKQCLYILARCNVYYESEDQEERHILTNGHMRDVYRGVGMELEMEKPGDLEMILKGFKYDRDVKQLASIAIANGFVHMGHGRDPLFLPREGDVKVPLDYGTLLGSDVPEMVTIFGSVGMIELWNPERVMETFQEQIFSGMSSRKIGSLLGLALSGLRSMDEASGILALLLPGLKSEDSIHVLAMLVGIEALFCGTGVEEAREHLLPLLFHESGEVVFLTAFVLGSVFCGSADEELVSLFLQIFVERSKESESQFFRLLLLGLGCLFYGRKDVECGVGELGGTLGKHASVLVKGFQNVGSGDSNVIESILAESFTGETDGLLESFGLLSCSLVAVGDDICTQMVARIVSSSLLLDSSHLRSVLPLCYGILYPSNPQVSVLDMLEKSLNSGETNCVMSTILAFGIIGAGTLNSRIGKVLDQQYSYYYKDAKVLSVLKVSQGLVSLGKGMLTLSPLFFDKNVLVRKNLLGLFGVLFMFLDPSVSPVASTHMYMFLMLCQACSPRYVTCAEKINVRVGVPVNVVGVVGEPRRLSSTQTHATPVVLSERVRAEADDDVCTSYIEDIVVLKRK